MALGLLSTLAPSLLSAGVGLLGSSRGQSQADDYAAQIAQASNPIDVSSQAGSVSFRNGNLGIRPNEQTLQQIQSLGGLSGGLLGMLGGMLGPVGGEDPAAVNAEVDRLRGIARPGEDALRSSLRSQVYNRGRLGLGVGGGISGAGFFNPELASLEEGFARADSGRVDQARGYLSDQRNEARGEQSRLLQSLFGLLGTEGDLRNQSLAPAQLALQGRQTAAGLSGYGAAAQRAGNANDAFFGSLGQTLGGLDFGSLFGGSSSPGANIPFQDYSLPYDLFG